VSPSTYCYVYKKGGANGPEKEAMIQLSLIEVQQVHKQAGGRTSRCRLRGTRNSRKIGLGCHCEVGKEISKGEKGKNHHGETAEKAVSGLFS